MSLHHFPEGNNPLSALALAPVNAILENELAVLAQHGYHDLI
jgi:hypothetical protein